MTAEEKFQALVDSNVFKIDESDIKDLMLSDEEFKKQIGIIILKLSTDSLESEDITNTYSMFQSALLEQYHFQYAALMLNSLGGPNGTYEALANGSGATSFTDLIALLHNASGLQVPGEGAGDWAQQYINAAVLAGFIPSPDARDDISAQAQLAALINSWISGGNTNTNETNTEGDAGSNAGGTGNYPSWMYFDYTAARSFTPGSALASLGSGCASSCVATYTGITDGTNGAGQSIGGLISLDFNFAQGNMIAATLDFNDMGGNPMGLVHYTGVVGSAQQPVRGVVSAGTFDGGSVTSVGGGPDLLGALFGPQAQELSGEWQFNVVGGGQPGVASGLFATSR